MKKLFLIMIALLVSTQILAEQILTDDGVLWHKGMKILNNTDKEVCVTLAQYGGTSRSANMLWCLAPMNQSGTSYTFKVAPNSSVDSWKNSATDTLTANMIDGLACKENGYVFVNCGVTVGGVDLNCPPLSFYDGDGAFYSTIYCHFNKNNDEYTAKAGTGLYTIRITESADSYYDFDAGETIYDILELHIDLTGTTN